MGLQNVFGQKFTFAGRLRAAIDAVEKAADKDPDTFRENVEQLEKEWGGRKDPVERSVVHAQMATAYREMTWTSISDYDEETRTLYGERRQEHLAHVLDDMEALAAAKVSAWSIFVERGKDSDVFNHDMLSVMVAFVISQTRMEAHEQADIYARAAKVYLSRGNKSGYGLMKKSWLDQKRLVQKQYGCLSAEQYKDSLYALLQEVKDVEVGADMALAYEDLIEKIDDRIQFLRWAQDNVGSSRRKGVLQQTLESALRPTLNMGGVNRVIANRSFDVSLSYWNCEQAMLTVRQYVGRQGGRDDRGALLLTGDVVARQVVNLPMDSANVARKAQKLPVRGSSETSFALSPGRYVLVAEGPGNRQVKEFRVSTLHLMLTNLNKEKSRLYVMDNETGRPLPGVKIQCRERLPVDSARTAGWEDRDLLCELTTGADGTVDVERKWWIRAVRNEHDHTNYEQVYGYWRNYEKPKGSMSMRLMTDRSIYRPGQKVMGSVMLYWQNGDEVHVADGDSLTLVVKDAQWKEISRQVLKTNEYGTAPFEFMLPADAAVGEWSLQASGAFESYYGGKIRVEEYKRPTFDVSFDSKRRGKFGQTIEAVGTAMMLAGVPVQSAQVHYTVECMPSLFRWWWADERKWQTLSEGDLTTDEAGQFKVPVFLTDEFVTGEYSLMRFRVKAQVTDVAGESHEAEWYVNVSNFECSVDVTVARMADQAKAPKVKLEVFDANHERVAKEGTYKILYGQNVVHEGVFTSGEEVLLPSALQPGVNYSIEATVVDSQGRKVEDRGYFMLYNSTMPLTNLQQLGVGEKRRAADALKESDVFYAEASEYEEGGNVELYLATAETDAYIICNVYQSDGLLDSYAAVTDGTMKRLRLPYRKEWGEGICVEVMYVRNGNFCQMKRTFTLARPEKKLKLEWATFRDKLQPGQQEQWTLTVTDHAGRRVDGAELMAVLYDAALDRIFYHNWNFGLYFPRYQPSVSVSNTILSSFPSAWLYGPEPRNRHYTRTFDRLKTFEHDRYSKMVMAGGRMYSRAMAVEEDGMRLNETADEAVVLEEAKLAEPTAPDTPEEPVDYENATIRENFAETAFFLPQLVSDSKGNVNIQFTLPESLTEWKFMGFAHTKDVDYGLIRATAVAHKAFMLRPNMPRFVRWGDHVVLAASVINQSEESLKGGVRMRLLDAQTGEVVFVQEKPFAMEAGQTVGVDFSFDVQEDWPDLDCEIVAVSGNVSDGEKNPLPVLSTKKEMVESVPYYIIGKGDGDEVSKTIDLSKLYNENSATATHRALQVEYTDNPAWMCIEALRSVQNPVEDDAIDYAASFYANTQLLELMRTFPLLKKHEDIETLQRRVVIAQEKLAGLQQADGGWSWFKGMSSSYYTTLAVCEHLAKIAKPDAETARVLKDGMAYLDKHELDAYNRAIKKKWKIWPSDSELRYLYVSAQMPDRVVSKEVQKMRENYLSKVAKAPRDLTIYGVANAAYSLRAFGYVKDADKFVDFLKDYTVEKPGQGRFYATDAAYYSWMDYRIPTQVAAMKAIRQKNPKDAYLNDMQLWLIAQKQVQKWDNPMNTIDVADFLLKVSAPETFHEAKKPVLIVDGSELTNMDYGTINTECDQLEGREANLVLEGNVLAPVPEEILAGGVQQLEVKKTTPSISWGAAYATFVEDVGNLKLYATNELKVQRKLYVQRMGSDRWEDYQEGMALTVGDKVKIRHIITADRDMDFVRVSAQHPACLEPLRHLSGYQWMGGRGCYLSIHDARFDMFFDWFTRGTSTVDMEYSVVRAGDYQVGVSTVECVYAKQFGGHTEGLKVQVTSAQK